MIGLGSMPARRWELKGAYAETVSYLGENDRCIWFNARGSCGRVIGLLFGVADGPRGKGKEDGIRSGASN